MSKDINIVISGVRYPDGRFGVGLKNYPGVGNALPWNDLASMEHFNNLIRSNVVLMGSGVWNSIPQPFRPLANCINIIITRKWMDSEITKHDLYRKQVGDIGRGDDPGDNIYFVSDIAAGLKLYERIGKRSGKDLFVIGGYNTFGKIIDKYVSRIRYVYAKIINSPEMPCNIYIDIAKLNLNIKHASDPITGINTLAGKIPGVPTSYVYVDTVYTATN